MYISMHTVFTNKHNKIACQVVLHHAISQIVIVLSHIMQNSGEENFGESSTPACILVGGKLW